MTPHLIGMVLLFVHYQRGWLDRDSSGLLGISFFIFCSPLKPGATLPPLHAFYFFEGSVELISLVAHFSN